MILESYSKERKKLLGKVGNPLRDKKAEGFAESVLTTAACLRLDAMDSSWRRARARLADENELPSKARTALAGAGDEAAVRQRLEAAWATPTLDTKALLRLTWALACGEEPLSKNDVARYVAPWIRRFEINKTLAPTYAPGLKMNGAPADPALLLPLGQVLAAGVLVKGPHRIGCLNSLLKVNDLLAARTDLSPVELIQFQAFLLAEKRAWEGS